MIGEDWQTRQSGDLVVLVLHLRTRPSSARRFMLMAKMSEPESRIRNISDTARWVAVYRARETERRDAVFRDAFARGLAGERGEQIAASISFAEKNSWPFVARTWLIDQVISNQVKLPASLQWIEVDLPEILAHKEDVLRNETPVCQVERVRLDLCDMRARGELFSQLDRRANRALVISEGLLVYLDEKQVTSLGQDLAVAPSFQHWVIDLASPALLKMLAKKMGAPLDQAGAPLKFAPREGPDFFASSGWKPVEIHSVMHAAAKLKRLPFFLRLIAKISSPAFQPRRPWSAVCLLAREL